MKVKFEFDNFTVIAKCKDINEYQEPIDLSLTFLDDNQMLVENELPFPVEAMADIEDTAIDMLYEKKYNPDLFEELYV